MPINVADLRIIKYPADVLKQKAHPVDELTEEVRAVAQRMIELMHEAEGIGLAAPQVGLSWRMFVADVPPADDRSPDDTPPTAMDAARVYINPTLSGFRRDLVSYEEGCLSIPGIVGEVRRPSEVTITALGLDGKEFTERGAELLARCWQHEYDHLDGVLILDRMTQRSRLKNRSAVKELEQGARIA
jgi:peptide deformylase